MQPRAGLMIYHKTVVALTALILGMPIAATILYSFATNWGPTTPASGISLVMVLYGVPYYVGLLHLGRDHAQAVSGMPLYDLELRIGKHAFLFQHLIRYGEFSHVMEQPAGPVFLCKLRLSASPHPELPYQLSYPHAVPI